MARVKDINERHSYPIDADTSFDKEGYCLTTGNDGEDHLRKTSGVGDVFMGINHKSSYDNEDKNVQSGGGPQPVASNDGMGEMSVEQDGVVNMLCEEGNSYGTGDAVYLSATEGVANNTNSGSDTRVGTVYKATDLTGASGPDFVLVNITGHV